MALKGSNSIVDREKAFSYMNNLGKAILLTGYYNSVMGFYIFWQQSNNTLEVIPQEFADISDSFAKGNSVDPDHTVPRGTV